MLDVDHNAAPAGQDLLALYDLHAAQRLAEGKRRKDTLEQDRIAVAQFAEFVGKARNVRTIKPDDVREWRNALAILPAAYRKHKAYNGMTMKEAADHARRVGARWGRMANDTCDQR